jgi:hypothetical protein
MKRFLLTAALGLMAAAGLHAESSHRSHTFIFEGTRTASEAVDGNFETTFLPFDQSLGTLQSITLSFYPAMSGSGNAPAGSAGASYSVSGAISFNGELITAIPSSLGFFGGGGGGGGGGLSGSPTTYTLMGGSSSYEQTHVLAEMSAADLLVVDTVFLGTNPFTVVWEAPVAFDLGNFNSVSVSVSAPMGITFNYLPVPEPGAAGLALGAGLFATGLRYHRRRRA